MPRSPSFQAGRLGCGPQDRDYGTRDFDAVDADGNQVTFGMGIPGTE